MLEKLRLWDISNELHALVDDGFRYTPNRVALGQLREFVYFNNVCDDMCIFDRHLVGQPGHRRAIRSSRRDEDLNVKILVQRLKCLDRTFRKIALRLGCI